jgi:sugar lactone lactonase YvrE
MRIPGWGHVPESTLAELADGGTLAAQLSPSERRHLETCDRCHGLLEGHRRAARLLAARWDMVPLADAAAAAGAPVRVIQRMSAGRGFAAGPLTTLQPRRSSVALISLLVVLGLMLWNVGGGLFVGGPVAIPPPSPSAIGTPPLTRPPSSEPAGTATPVPAFTPPHLAIDSLGRLYATDCLHGRVFRLSKDVGPVTIAGGGFHSFTDDPGPATDAPLACPYGIAFNAAGDLFVADTGNNRVRMVDSTGLITTVAGSGPIGWGLGHLEGDGAPATEARLGNPAGIAFDAEGNLYISDMRNHRIRKVDPNGIITTIAGNGALYPPFGGDGGLAIDAALNDPQGIAIDTQGNIYFVDTHNNRLRMIDHGGRISTIAGTGELASFGDEGPAVDAALAGPRAVAVDAAGNVYVSEAVWDVFGSEPSVGKGLGNRVRRIDPNGIIHAFAGTGEIGFAGDGGPATEAQLNGVNESFGLAIDAAGNVYIADSKNDRIRMVDANGIIATFADGSR